MQYPVKKSMPKHTYKGEKWRTMPANKKRLVSDFNHRCAYCDDYDYFGGGPAQFEVDHFAPKSKFAHLRFVYENLLYCCKFCNGAKSNTWVGRDESEPILGNCGFVSPCSPEYSLHLCRDSSGVIQSKTELGAYMHKELKLFLKRHQIMHMIEEIALRRDIMIKRIEEAKVRGACYKELEEASNAISATLCDYYALLHKNESGI